MHDPVFDVMKWAFPCFFCFMVIFVATSLILAHNKIQATKADYDSALQSLKIHPSDPAARERVFTCGRAYISALRSNQRYGGLSFTEQSLMNDIALVTERNSVPIKPPEPEEVSVEARLAKLESLYSSGVVSLEEYEAHRARILAEL